MHGRIVTELCVKTDPCNVFESIADRAHNSLRNVIKDFKTLPRKKSAQPDHFEAVETRSLPMVPRKKERLGELQRIRLEHKKNVSNLSTTSESKKINKNVALKWGG